MIFFFSNVAILQVSDTGMQKQTFLCHLFVENYKRFPGLAVNIFGNYKCLRIVKS